MHQLWNYVKSTIISHFHTNCKFSPNLMMHTKRKCKCSKIVDPTAIKIIQMCLCDWLFVELELIKLTQEKKTQMATALLNALDLTRCLSRLPFFILANIYFFLFPLFAMHALINIKVNVKSNVEITLNILRPSPSSFSPSNEIIEVNF